MFLRPAKKHATNKNCFGVRGKIQMSKRKETGEGVEKKKILRPDSVAYFKESLQQAPERLKLLEDRIIPMLQKCFPDIKVEGVKHELVWGLHEMVHTEDGTRYTPTEYRSRGINILEIPSLSNGIVVMVDVLNDEFVVIDNDEPIDDGEFNRLTSEDYAADHIYDVVCRILEADEDEDEEEPQAKEPVSGSDK